MEPPPIGATLGSHLFSPSVGLCLFYSFRFVPCVSSVSLLVPVPANRVAEQKSPHTQTKGRLTKRIMDGQGCAIHKGSSTTTPRRAYRGLVIRWTVDQTVKCTCTWNMTARAGTLSTPWMGGRNFGGLYYLLCRRCQCAGLNVSWSSSSSISFNTLGFIGITLFPAPDVEVDNSWPSHFDSFCFGTVNLDVDGTRAAQRRTNEILL
jgi:hypothetical protein